MPIGNLCTASRASKQPFAHSHSCSCSCCCCVLVCFSFPEANPKSFAIYEQRVAELVYQATHATGSPASRLLSKPSMSPSPAHNTRTLTLAHSLPPFATWQATWLMRSIESAPCSKSKPHPPKKRCVPFSAAFASLSKPGLFGFVVSPCPATVLLTLTHTHALTQTPAALEPWLTSPSPHPFITTLAWMAFVRCRSVNNRYNGVACNPRKPRVRVGVRVGAEGRWTVG